MNFMVGSRLRSVCLLLSLALLVAAPAWASDDRGRRHGSCSGGPGHWKLAVHPVTSTTMRIRLDIEDADPGERWQLFLSVDGKRILSVTRRTDAEGDVHAKKVAADRHGSDRIKASGVNIDSGGSCAGSLTY
jgi:hypothetical protein